MNQLMVQNKKGQEAALFTAMLADESIRSKTQRIKGPADLDAFQSGVFVSGDEDSAVSTEQWIEAHEDKETGRWHIKAHECSRVKGNSEEDTHAQETVLRNLCYFDAVHYCAYIEQLGNADPERRLIAPDDEYFKDSDNVFTVHYRAPAEEYGIAFDKEDMPHPVAGGEILTNGEFHPRAYQVAEKTKSHQLISIEDFKGSARLLPIAGVPDSITNGALNAQDLAAERMKAVQTSHDTKQHFLMAKDHLKNLVDMLDRLTDGYCAGFRIDRKKNAYEFSARDGGDLVWRGFLNSVTLGILPATYYVIRRNARDLSENNRSTKHSVYNLCKDFRSAYKKLPEEERALCADFEKAAKSSYWLMRAAYTYRNADNKVKSIKKVFSYVDKGAKIAGLEAREVNHIKQQFMENAAPAENRYGTFLAEKHKALSEHLSACAAQIKPAI